MLDFIQILGETLNFVKSAYIFVADPIAASTFTPNANDGAS